MRKARPRTQTRTSQNLHLRSKAARSLPRNTEHEPDRILIHDIDPQTYLSDLLVTTCPDMLATMLQASINQLLSAQADSQCGADYATVSTDRINQRNGYRHRQLDTRLGTPNIAIPKLRKGTYFSSWLLDNGPYYYLACDALTIKVREGGRVVKTSVLLATGVNKEGYRELLGMQVATSESEASWTAFFGDLHTRGLTQAFMITSDAHLGIQAAIATVLPTASWQRCRTHFAKNFSGMVSKTQWPALSGIFHAIFQQPDAKATWDQAREVIAHCHNRYPDVGDYLEQALDDLLAFTAAPKAVWTKIWSTTPPNDSTAKSVASVTS